MSAAALRRSARSLSLSFLKIRVSRLKCPLALISGHYCSCRGRQHTVRGAIAGALKKRLGLDVQSEKIYARSQVYRLAEG